MPKIKKSRLDRYWGYRPMRRRERQKLKNEVSEDAKEPSTKVKVGRIPK